MSPQDERIVHAEVHPTDELLLAQSLETCLRAERVLPGSSDAIVARVPDSARAELTRLLQTARLVEEAAASATPSPEFKATARARLMRRITTGLDAEPTQPIVLTALAGRPRRSARRRWLLRGVGGLLAAGLTAAATLTASASALPGEPLYPVKQAKEEVAVRMAADDQARALALVQRANARLDETTRLLQQGRTEDALQTAAQYDESVDRATSTLVTALGPQPGTSPAAERFAVALAEQQVQIEQVLPEAPVEAQAELREALQTTERGRALAANPAPVKQALNQPLAPTQAPPVVAAPRAETAAETQATQAPTFTPAPPTPVVVQEPEPEPEVARVEEVRDEVQDDRGEDRGPDNADVSANGGSGNAEQGGGSAPQAAPRQVTAPAQVARPAVVPPRPSTSAGPGPTDEQRGGGDGVTSDRGADAEQHGGGSGSGDDQRVAPTVAEDQHGGPGSNGEDQHVAPASVAEDQHGGPSHSGDDQRGGGPSGGDDERRGPSGGDDQRRGGASGGDAGRRGGEAQQSQQQSQPQQQQQQQQQAPSLPATQVAHGQDGGGDGQRGGGQNGSASQSGSGEATATSAARPSSATTAPVVPPTATRNDGGGDQTAKRSGGDDQAAARPGVQQQQPTLQQQPTRAPTATPTRPQNQQPAQQTQPPQQTQNPSLQNNNNNNRSPATTTTTGRGNGGRSGNDDSSNKTESKGGGR